MGKKWQKIDPAELKVGDRVRRVAKGDRILQTTEGIVTTAVGKLVGPKSGLIYVGGVDFSASVGDWYVRRPKPAKPLTRPDEPPIGTFFRVERTGETYWHHYPLNGTAYWHLVPYTGNGVSPEWHCWERITEPGDTITMLDLVERES